MKRMVLIVMLGLLALGISSCDNRDGDSDLPSFVDVIFSPKEDFYLVLEYTQDIDLRDSDVYCSLVSKMPLKELWIETQRVYPEYMNVVTQNGDTFYRYDMDMSYLSGALPTDYNEEVVYQIKFADKTVSGSMLMPAEYLINPPDFDPEQDYSLQWILGADPRAQVVNMKLDGSVTGSHYSYIKEISPAARAYTFRKSLWSGYQPEEDFEINLEAHNYSKTEGGIIWYMSTYCAEEYNWNRQARHRERVDKLIRGVSGSIR